jgi:hypothetical protein
VLQRDAAGVETTSMITDPTPRTRRPTWSVGCWLSAAALGILA